MSKLLGWPKISIALLALPAVLLIGLPLVAALWLIVTILTQNGSQDWLLFLSTSSVLTGLLYSIALAIIPTLLALYSAFWLLARMAKPPAWIAALLAIPHVAFAIGLSLLLLPGGWISRVWLGLDLQLQIPLLTPFLSAIFTDKSLPFLLVTLWLKELPFLLLMALIVMQQLPVREWQQVGASFGYRAPQTFWRIIVPQLVRRLRLPIMVVAIYGLAVVDVALVVGPNLPSPLAVQVLQWYQQAGSELFAALGSVVLIVASALVLFLFRAHEWLHNHGALLAVTRGVKISGQAALPSFMRRPGIARLRKFLAQLPFAVFLVVQITTVIALLVWSFTAAWPNTALLPSSYSVANWQWEWQPLQEVLWNSLWIGVVVASLATALVLLMLEWEYQRGKRIADAYMLLPLLVPQLPLVMAWHMHVAPFTLAAPAFWLVWAHTVFAAAYIWLTLAASYRNFPNMWLTQAATLGYSAPQRWFKVRLRMLAAPIVLAWSVGFSVSILQYLPTLIFGAGRILTVTTEATAYGSGFERSLAAIYGLAQIAWPLMMFVVAAILANKYRVHTIRGA